LTTDRCDAAEPAATTCHTSRSELGRRSHNRSGSGYKAQIASMSSLASCGGVRGRGGLPSWCGPGLSLTRQNDFRRRPRHVAAGLLVALSVACAKSPCSIQRAASTTAANPRALFLSPRMMTHHRCSVARPCLRRTENVPFVLPLRPVCCSTRCKKR
jgi:hypothetical protein